eukprot:m51a1_g12923 hypothetical protein (109) ;mRNA; r:2240-2695
MDQCRVCYLLRAHLNNTKGNNNPEASLRDLLRLPQGQSDFLKHAERIEERLKAECPAIMAYWQKRKKSFMYCIIDEGTDIRKGIHLCKFGPHSRLLPSRNATTSGSHS